MPNEFNIKNGFITSGNSNVYANLNVTGGLTATTISATTYFNLPFSGSVIGSGTTGYLPKWTGSTGLSNSLVYDSTTGVTIGTGFTWDNTNGWLSIKKTNPAVEIDVTGSIRASSTVFTDVAQFNFLQTSGSNLLIRGSGGTSYATMFQTTGNFVLQNGGTFTDAGYRLDVNGSGRILNGAAQLLVNNATHSELAYGTTNYFRANGSSAIVNGPGIQFLRSGNEVARFASTTGNFLINTSTDAGYKLDVVGSTKLRTETYFGSISQPNAPTLTTNSTTGGTLSAATYYYRIVAVDFYGNTTTPSNELAVTTTGSTSRVTIGWTLVSGAYNYRIYRGTTSGGQNLYYTVAGTNTTSFIDTGAAGTAGTTPTVNLTAYGSYANTSGAFRSGNITIVNNGVGNTSQIVFDKSTDSPAINVVEYASDSTMFEFSLRDNPDGAGDFFNWVLPDWQNDSTGWKPLKFSDLTQQFIAQTTNFWSSFLLPSSTPYYTTGPATLSNSPNKFNPFTSTSYNLIKDAGSGTGVFNVDVTGFTGSINRIYWVIIQTGATTFNWGTGSYLNAPIGTGVVITGGWQLLDNGVNIKITGAVLATDRWSFRAFPVPRMGIGTTTPISPLQISTTVAATGAIARGMYLNPTLLAAANNDVLVGLDIDPTFTNGAFTGVTNIGLRCSVIAPTSPNSGSVGLANRPYNNGFFGGIVFSNTYQNYNSSITFSLSYVNIARFFTGTGNFTLQNGGTFTDAGFRLDVFGNSRISGNLTVTGNTSLQSLTATTISATTYQNLPSQSGTGVSSLSYTPTTGILTLTKNDTTTLTAGTFTYLTGSSYSNNIITFTNNIGSSSTITINTVTGLTVNGGLTVTGNTSLQGLTATTISATTYQNLPSFTFTGGTVSGATNFTGGLSGNTFSATTATIRKITGGSGNTNSGTYSFIGGGQSNIASNNYSTVGGGSGNTASAIYSNVVGGCQNTASGNYSFVGGGKGNSASVIYSTISGGYCNINGAESGFIGAGRTNTMTGITGGVIGGGTSNTVSNNYSVVGGGVGNTVSGYISFVGGGSTNTASGSYSTVGGGRFNTASDYFSTISGGYCNRTSGTTSFIGGGSCNTIAGGKGSCYSTISGGYFNNALSNNSHVLAGQGNVVYSQSATILGGNLNSIASSNNSLTYSVYCTNSGTGTIYITGNYTTELVIGNTFYYYHSVENRVYKGDITSSTYSGGYTELQGICAGNFNSYTDFGRNYSNIITNNSCNSVITGGNSNTIGGNNSNCSFIGGGYRNYASNFYSIVVGGAFNTTSGYRSFIGGGTSNTVSANDSIVIGGQSNTVSGYMSFIGGGLLNTASGCRSFIGGGTRNTASGYISFVGNGKCNVASGNTSTISGGYKNTAGGACSFVGGGICNRTTGTYSFVGAGSGNTVTGNFSAAIGCGLNATAACTLYTNNIITGGLTATTISATGNKGTVTTSGNTSTAFITISGSNTVGGASYVDFLRVTNNSVGATNPTKTIRVNNTGGMEFLNSVYTGVTLTIADNGILYLGGGGVATVSNNDATSNYLSFNLNNSQIYDDGNTHIHSRGAGQSMWINTNGGQLNLLAQSPTSGGSIGSGIAIATGSLIGYVTINTGKTYTTSVSYGYLVNSATPTGQYPGGSQSVSISLYATARIWAQEFDAFSDERMKNIQGTVELDEALKLVNDLKPIKYTWKEGDDKGLKVGYSAQQVSKAGFDHLIGVLPKEGLEETIDEDGFVSPKDTQFSMNYEQVTPYHGVVIKHLLEEIENLKKEIKELKNKVG